MIYVPIKRGYVGLYIRKFLPPNLPIHDKSSTCLSHVLYFVLITLESLTLCQVCPTVHAGQSDRHMDR